MGRLATTEEHTVVDRRDHLAFRVENLLRRGVEGIAGWPERRHFGLERLSVLEALDESYAAVRIGREDSTDHPVRAVITCLRIAR